MGMSDKQQNFLTWFRTIAISVSTAAILWIGSMQKEMYDAITKQPAIDKTQSDDIADLKDREKRKLDLYLQTSNMITLYVTQKIKEATDQMVRVDSLLEESKL